MIVKNLSPKFNEYKNEYPYTVVRECKDGYWYYGMYNNSEYASRIAKHIRNGVVVESKNVEYGK